jgi:ABC-type antimicrobial peptide transport system permease subunit
MRVAHLGSVLFGAFGGLALLLSLVGMYALKAYAVARRTREIGIRMALGANRRDVITLILWESASVAVLGLSLGLVLALAVGKLAGSFLYHVATTDPLTFSLIPLLLLLTSLLACFVPARRAAMLDPIKALRYE